MANFNKIILLGNLTRDPQLSYLPSQTPVVEFGLAVNRKYKTSDGQEREDTCFIDCRCYGRQAEIINQYMSKGRPILVEGRLQLDQWEGKDGQKRSKHRVFVENFQFLGGGGGGGSSSGGGGYANRQGGSRQAPRDGGGGQSQAPQDDFGDAPPSSYDEGGEEIPF